MIGEMGEAIFRDVDAYQAAMSSAYYPMRLRRKGSSSFFASVDSARVGDIEVTRAVANGRFEAEHNYVPLPQGRSRLVLFLHEEGGDILIEGQKTVRSRPGVIMLFNSSDKVRSEQCNEAGALSLALPTSLMLGSMPMLSAALFSPIASDRGSAAMLREFMQSMWRHRRSMQASDARGTTQALLRLIECAFRDLNSVAVQTSPTVSRHFFALSRLVDEEICNPDLSVSYASSKLGVSSSYIQVILRRSGITFRNLVLEKRLELCRAALQDSTQTHRSISAIAFDYGFQDSAHFSRRFTERYGMPPRAYRRQPGREDERTVAALP